MNDIEKKRREEKKKGFLAWLREKLGFGSRGNMGAAPEGLRNINLQGLRGISGASRIAGASRFGAGGIFSFLGGKAGLITMGLVALAVGATLYYKNASMGDNSSTNSSMGQEQIASYVPKILRDQNNSSTLGMFDKNGINLDEEAKRQTPENEEPPKKEAVTPENIKPELGFENKPQLQTNMQFGLSSDISGGSNKFSALGGFGNHMGKFGPSVKGDFDKNDLLKKASGNKLSSMSGQKRAVVAQGAKFQSVKGGKRAFDQAKAIKSMQMQPNYGKADSARSTLDKAWEGATGAGFETGLPSGGSGISDGGSGIVQSPSTLDNIGDTQGGVPDNQVPNNPNYKFDTPWAGLLQKAMMLLMISALLAGIASMVAKIPVWGKILAVILAIAAIALAVMVIMIGMQIMSQYGQKKLGMIYIIGGGLAIAGAIAAIGGAFFGWNMLFAQILSAAAGIMGMFASMAAGPATQDMINKQTQQQTEQTQTTSKAESYQRFIG